MSVSHLSTLHLHGKLLEHLLSPSGWCKPEMISSLSVLKVIFQVDLG